jgi:hypothetical protein
MHALCVADMHQAMPLGGATPGISAQLIGPETVTS